MLNTLKSNFILSLFTQLYLAGIGFIVLPIYFYLIGKEGYGLIGFFFTLQICFNILDLGLTPGVSRESARFRAGSVSSLLYTQLLGAFGTLFTLLSVGSFILIALNASNIAGKWLKFNVLTQQEVVICLYCMAFCIACRLISGLPRGMLIGHERFMWLSVFNVGIGSLKFLIVIPVLWFCGETAQSFFIYQAIIAGLEAFILFIKGYRLRPILKINALRLCSLKPLGPFLKFSMMSAITAFIWLILSQADKIILSNILSLEDYGYFSIAITLSNLILLVSSTVSSVLLPRMTRLASLMEEQKLLNLYRRMSQLVLIIVSFISIFIILAAKPILEVWFQDKLLAIKIAPLLQPYLLGNSLCSLVAFPYYLQYAKGNLTLHFIGHMLLLLIFLPLLFCIALKYGALGTGYVWLSMHAIYLLGWGAIVHKRFSPGFHHKWLLRDLLKIIFVFVTMGVGYFIYSPQLKSPYISILFVLLYSIVVMGVAATTVTPVRNQLKNIWCKYIKSRVPLTG